MVPSPGFRHAEIESQLHGLLRAPATAAGLTMTGQFNLGDDVHDFRVPMRAFTGSVPKGPSCLPRPS